MRRWWVPEPGSQTLEFRPGQVHAGDYRFAVGTAGSCTLVLQTVLPPLMLADAPSRLHLSGGTHNPMAPPFHFLQRSFAPLMRRAGAKLDLTLRRHGFYPAGGGEIEAVITPADGGLRPFDLLERGEPVEAFAEAVAPALPRGVAERELEALERLDQLGHASTAHRHGTSERRPRERVDDDARVRAPDRGVHRLRRARGCRRKKSHGRSSRRCAPMRSPPARRARIWRISWRCRSHWRWPVQAARPRTRAPS